MNASIWKCFYNVSDAVSLSDNSWLKAKWIGEAVGRRVRELRGLYTTQKDFAKRIEVSQNYLSVIEHGEAEVGAAVFTSD